MNSWHAIDLHPVSNHTGLRLQALAAAVLAAVGRLPLEPDLSAELASPKTESTHFESPGNPHFQDIFLFLHFSWSILSNLHRCIYILVSYSNLAANEDFTAPARLRFIFLNTCSK